jgi:hypothetical protein
MTTLCYYKDIFGAPNQGTHSYRIFNIAIVDLVFTIFGGYLISLFFKINFIEITLVLLLLGIIFHRIFCVKTTINNLIFN